MTNLLKRWLQTQLWATLMVVAYIALAFTFSVTNPIHEATDEIRHYRYIRYIADLHQLPEQSGEEGNAQAHHPPLYYLTAALLSGWVHVDQPLYEPQENPHFAFRSWEVSTDNKNLYLHNPNEAWPYRYVSLATHLARWVTMLWGAAAVALTIAIARIVFPDSPAVSIAAAALIAFCPMFAYLGGAVNNDVPAGLAGAALTCACLIVIRDGLTHRKAVVLGVLFGLANLVKFNLIAMYGVVELALILSLLAEPSHKGFWRRVLAANSMILGIAALLCGWWYVRNTMLYGEPTGMLRLTEIWGYRPPSEGVQLSGVELAYAWTSLWARFSYGQIPVPTIFYTITAILSVIGIVGLAAYLLRSPRTFDVELQVLSRKQHYMLLVLAASVIVNFMVLYIYLSIQPQGAMGRFVFPGLPAFAVLIAGGLIAVLPRAARPVIAGALSVGMLSYVLATLFGYLIPAYAIPAQAEPPANPLELEIGDYARILDYEISSAEAHPGDTVDLTVTWQILKPTPEPYQVFIQLLSRVDRAYIDVAQRDTYTGLGNYPSQWWRPGHIFTETYRLYLPDTLDSPDRLLIQLGMYNDQQKRIPATNGDHVDFAEITIPADPSAEYPNEISYNWDNKFELIGYDIPVRAFHPGENFTVILYWKALNPPKDENFKVFVHLIDANMRQWGVRDGNPVWSEGWSSEWVAGTIYEDSREVFMDPNVPPGVYELQIGWFSDTDGERLNIIAEDGHVINNYLRLPGVRVLEPGT